MAKKSRPCCQWVEPVEEDEAVVEKRGFAYIWYCNRPADLNAPTTWGRTDLCQCHYDTMPIEEE